MEELPSVPGMQLTRTGIRELVHRLGKCRTPMSWSTDYHMALGDVQNAYLDSVIERLGQKHAIDSERLQTLIVAGFDEIIRHWLHCEKNEIPRARLLLEDRVSGSAYRKFLMPTVYPHDRELNEKRYVEDKFTLDRAFLKAAGEEGGAEAVTGATYQIKQFEMLQKMKALEQMQDIMADVCRRYGADLGQVKFAGLQ